MIAKKIFFEFCTNYDSEDNLMNLIPKISFFNNQNSVNFKQAQKVNRLMTYSQFKLIPNLNCACCGRKTVRPIDFHSAFRSITLPLKSIIQRGLLDHWKNHKYVWGLLQNLAKCFPNKSFDQINIRIVLQFSFQIYVHTWGRHTPTCAHLIIHWFSFSPPNWFNRIQFQLRNEGLELLMDWHSHSQQKEKKKQISYCPIGTGGQQMFRQVSRKFFKLSRIKQKLFRNVSISVSRIHVNSQTKNICWQLYMENKIFLVVQW